MCSKCNTFKELELFKKYYNKSKGSCSIGYRNICIQCDNKRTKELYDTEKSIKAVARAKKWCLENPEKYKEKYVKTNKEKGPLRAKKYREAHPEKVKQEARIYRENNPEKFRQYSIARRAREAGAEGSFSLEEFNDLCDKNNWECLCCGKRTNKLTVDHIVPLSKGGTNLISNIQPLCSSCNSRKHAKTIDFRSSYT